MGAGGRGLEGAFPASPLPRGAGSPAPPGTFRPTQSWPVFWVLLKSRHPARRRGASYCPSSGPPRAVTHLCLRPGLRIQPFVSIPLVPPDPPDPVFKIPGAAVRGQESIFSKGKLNLLLLHSSKAWSLAVGSRRNHCYLPQNLHTQHGVLGLGYAPLSFLMNVGGLLMQRRMAVAFSEIRNFGVRHMDWILHRYIKLS
ncbi:uncharacterized protein LOC100454686 isoform X2 [Pongo abelii]|uniref:uncharacterized protein LOC100454686 isoform X2 n=1 Tax=Pongo abelii TaxID=9601 RepID=UPI0023E82460|nr:uncharacterized protein LOC100454686 isoform X2 [Pongo abelii]